MQTGLTLIVALLSATAGTRLAIDWLAARRLVAVENQRTMHQGSVPQGGGAPVVASLLVATLLLWPWTTALMVTAASAAALAVMSALNDRRDIAFQWRLMAHAIAAAAVLSVLPAATLVFGGLLPFALDRGVTLLAMVWFINLYNFMDGIDGITGIETITIAGGALAVRHLAGGVFPFEGLALALCGAAAGFLVWNWHRARIFLGDVGSIPLGLLTGVLLVEIATRYSLAAAIILPLYYLTDATVTLLKRAANGEKVWQAHRRHAYQRAAAALRSHSAVVVRIAACNVVLVAAAVLALAAPLLALLAAAMAVGVLMWQLEAIASGAARPAGQGAALAGVARRLNPRSWS